MKETLQKTYSEGGRKYRIRAKYGIDYEFGARHSQAPHFSVTGDTEMQDAGAPHRWREDRCGCIHDEIAKRFPELRPYIKWHLVSTDSPLHYLANAKYWWEIANGKRAGDKYQRVDPWDAFRSTVVFGGLPDDESTAPDRRAMWEVWERWLRDRLPRLMQTFEHAMKTLGVWETRR